MRSSLGCQHDAGRQAIHLSWDALSTRAFQAGCQRVAAEQLLNRLSKPAAMDISLACALTFSSLAQGQSSSDLLQLLLGLGAESGSSPILALALPVAHVLLGFLGPLIMCIMDKPPAMFRLPSSSATASGHIHSRPSDPDVSSERPADLQQHSHGESPAPWLLNVIAASLFPEIRDYIDALRMCCMRPWSFGQVTFVKTGLAPAVEKWASMDHVFEHGS